MSYLDSIAATASDEDFERTQTMNAVKTRPTVTVRFFIVTPTPTEASENDGGFRPYLDAEGLRMWWSGKKELPKIGDTVKVTMNGIGPAVVKGFFVEWGGGDSWYVGVMALPKKPPKYYRENVQEDKKNPNKPAWMKEGIGCFFGSEIE